MSEPIKTRIQKRKELQPILDVIASPAFLEICEAALLEYQSRFETFQIDDDDAAAFYHNSVGARQYMSVLLDMSTPTPPTPKPIRQNLES